MTGYNRIRSLLADGACVVLDGGLRSEIARRTAGACSTFAQCAGPWAIYDHTEEVLGVHHDYAAAGCDVVSTHTWGLLGSMGQDRGRRPGRTGLPAWTVATRDAVMLARRGLAMAGRADDCAVAFCLNDADPLLTGEEPLLSLLWNIDPPDLVLVETLRAPLSPPLQHAIAEVAESEMPVWVSFQRPLAGSPGERWFPQALSGLQELGVQAALVNCVPWTDAADAIAEATTATRLPVGVYPRLDGHLTPERYARLANQWIKSGAQIIGGCCGVGPDHMRAVSLTVAESGQIRIPPSKEDGLHDATVR